MNEEQSFASGISLADEEAVKEVLASSVLGLWEVVNNLTRLRPSTHERYRVTIFGSARLKPGTAIYDEAKRVSAAVASMGCDIVTGGGPGLMQAANEGAASVGAPERDRSIGIRVELPFEQGANPFVFQAFTHRTFFTRLHHFVLASDLFVVGPGGIGTVLEATMVWQLLQVHHADAPLIFVGPMWKELVEWCRRHMLSFDPPLVSPGDLEIPQCANDADEAIALISSHYEQWLKKKGA